MEHLECNSRYRTVLRECMGTSPGKVLSLDLRLRRACELIDADRFAL
ncbi:MAG: hypothetical protein ACLR23_09190 [Clostridia bacterium]